MPGPRRWATLDRDAIDALARGTPLEVQWQVSRNLQQWQPGPASQFVRREGRFSIERILLTPGDPPFARLSIRRAR